MSKGKMPAITPQIQAAIDRSRQHDAGKLRLQQCIAELDRLQALQNHVVHETANALAAIEGKPITITHLEANPQTMLLAAITFQDALGTVQTMRIDRTPPPSGLVTAN